MSFWYGTPHTYISSACEKICFGHLNPHFALRGDIYFQQTYDSDDAQNDADDDDDRRRPLTKAAVVNHVLVPSPDEEAEEDGISDCAV